MNDPVASVRALHAPDGASWLRCRGCDANGYEAEDPEWPCRTAELVYTAEEISDITEAAHWFGKWTRQMGHRNPAPPRSFSQWMEDAFSHAFGSLGSDSANTSVAMAMPSGRTVNASVIAHQMKVSTQLLKDIR